MRVFHVAFVSSKAFIAHKRFAFSTFWEGFRISRHTVVALTLTSFCLGSACERACVFEFVFVSVSVCACLVILRDRE